MKGGGGTNDKLFDATYNNDDEDLLADHHHLHRSKKPPVPIPGIRRKTWNRPNHQMTAESTTYTDDDHGMMGSKKKTSPVSLRKTRSQVTVGDGSIFLRKVKSTPSKPSKADDVHGSGNSRRRSEVSILSDESGITIQKNVSNIESVETSFGKMAILIENEINGSDECQEKLITSNVSGNECADAEKEEDDDDDDDDEVDQKSVEDQEIEIEKKNYDVEEVTVPDNKFSKTIQVGDNVEDEDVKVCQIADKKAVQSALAVKQPPRYVRRSAFYSDFNESGHSLAKASTNPSPKPGSKFTKLNPSFTAPAASIPQPDEFQRHPASRDRLQSLVDLVMWRDVSRSAFVFGTGIFIIISSSYTQDLNISFISVTSYFALAYLALRFLLRSILHRGVIHVDNDAVVGEEEAVWIVKLVLPYVNEFFLSLRALFSGDPATTMKLALVLFVLARCGSSITIWKMAKLGFVGVFTVPKVVSSYSLLIKTQCKFWIGRFRDAWETCSHKKIIAGIIFSLVWNLCSVVARIWALFMVAVAFRYYQQLMADDEEWEEEHAKEKS